MDGPGPFWWTWCPWKGGSAESAGVDLGRRSRPDVGVCGVGLEFGVWCFESFDLRGLGEEFRAPTVGTARGLGVGFPHGNRSMSSVFPSWESSLQIDRVALWESEVFIDNLLVRIHFILEMIWWTGLVLWQFEFPFGGSLISTCSDSNMTFPLIYLAWNARTSEPKWMRVPYYINRLF